MESQDPVSLEAPGFQSPLGAWSLPGLAGLEYRFPKDRESTDFSPSSISRTLLSLSLLPPTPP